MTERNEPCHCGSGRKYKKCCLEKDRTDQASIPDNLPSHVRDRSIPGIVDLFERFASEPYFQAMDRLVTPDFMEQMYRTHFYRDWGDTPIPALANQTPRQHARTERGEAAVVDLVRSYQAQENRMAREQGRKPVDLSWLLAEAGVKGTL
ncbi:MAG TPA: SEC-C metal-binding domain-containing protein [Fibrobacteria bacterium]|nr:SEC-C metal-binding domain-containing protein [Fibrobacteria bacterium]